MSIERRVPAKAFDARLHPDGRSVEGRKVGRLSDRVRHHVYDQIIGGTLEAGSVIQIASLAAELGVSRTPVREALLSLQETNLLQVIPNQGFLVCSISLADVSDIYMMRRLLEGTITERAATRLSGDTLADLTARHESTRQAAIGNRYDTNFDALCYDFHRKISVASDSPRLVRAVDTIFDDAARLQSIGANPPDPEIIVKEHQGILDALAAKNPSQARTVMEDHIDTLRATALAGVFD